MNATTVSTRPFQKWIVYTAAQAGKQYVSLDDARSLGRIPRDVLSALPETVFNVEIIYGRKQPTVFLLVTDVLQVVDPKSEFGTWLQGLGKPRSVEQCMRGY